MRSIIQLVTSFVGCAPARVTASDMYVRLSTMRRPALNDVSVMRLVYISQTKLPLVFIPISICTYLPVKTVSHKWWSCKQLAIDPLTVQKCRNAHPRPDMVYFGHNKWRPIRVDIAEPMLVAAIYDPTVNTLQGIPNSVTTSRYIHQCQQ